MNTIDTVECPECHHHFTLDDALKNQIAGEMSAELKAQMAAQAREYSKKMKGVDELKQQLAVQAKTKLEEDKAKLVAAAEARTRAEAESEITLAKDELAHTKEQLTTARQKELDLRKEKQVLQADKEAFEVEKQRQLDDEREKIKVAAKKASDTENEQVVQQLKMKVEQLSKMSDEFKRKAEQGSQQSQGEVAELGLETALENNFPLDVIKPIKKGVNGADTLQEVHSRNGRIAGNILWESKNTKEWSNGWVTKLKDDQRSAKADIAVLVSATLPAGSKPIEQRDGVWVCGHDSVIGLAMSLRQGLENVAAMSLKLEGNSEKKTIIFNYLISVDFRHHIEAIFESFVTMRSDIQRERSVANKNFDKRDKQLLVIESHVSGMYGDLQGLMGSAMPEIDLLDDDIDDPMPALLV